MRRRLPLAAGLALMITLSSPLPGAAANGPTAAARQYARAEASFQALRESPQAQRQRQNFTSVLEAYRLVFEKFPGTRQGEASLLRAGELLTLLFRWTGRAGDLNQAQNYYERLVQSFPKSPLVDDALLAIAYLYLDHFKDPAQAWLRFRAVGQLAPRGDKVAEAKWQLKRLAKYAAPDKPAGAGAPAPAAAPAVIAAQPPPVIAMPEPAIIEMPAALAPPPPKIPVSLNRVRDIRHWSNPEYSRVVIDLDQKTNFYSNLLEDRSGVGTPPRLYIDLFNSLIEARMCKPISVNDGILHGIRAGQYTADTVRVVLDIDGLRTYRIFPMQDPFRIVVDVTGGDPAEAATPVASNFEEPGRSAATAAPQSAPATPAPPEDSLSPPLSARMTPAAPVERYTPVPVPSLIPLPGITPPGAPNVPASRTAAATPPPANPLGPTTFSGAVSAAVPGPAPAPAPAVSRLSPAPAPARAPGPRGKPSLARQLGLGVRRVVIDAGHGAHDPGAIGIGGLQEKEVTLDLALRVRDLLQAAGYETVLTRDHDVYLPLEERTALANTSRGDLFLSLHCNASDAGNLRGVETYFLNLASSKRSMRTAARENSMAVANMSDLQQIVREIQNSKMDESSQFAERVQRSLHDALHRKYPDVQNLGVKQAPFYVLIGAQMPSILAEVSFINHRTEGRRLADPAYRQLIAQALVDGVKRYIRTVKTAAQVEPGKATR
ncbi:MAG: N-acetylmuramoyl-L-alanine amidase [Candidatus Methylomirabilia bacterium]